MWELLPDSATVHAIVQWLVLVIVVLLALGVGTFALALGAMGLEKVKREGKKLLGQPEVLALADGIANLNVTRLHQMMDDPNDALILLLAQRLRQDPAGMVKTIDGAFTIFGQAQLIWPQIKEALGLVTPPKPAEGLQNEELSTKQ
jgi:hypothetical protein